MDCSLSGSSVRGVSQAGILEWVAISFSGGFTDPGIKPVPPALAGGFFTPEPPGKPLRVAICYEGGRGVMKWPKAIEKIGVCVCSLIVSDQKKEN